MPCGGHEGEGFKGGAAVEAAEEGGGVVRDGEQHLHSETANL